MKFGKLLGLLLIAVILVMSGCAKNYKEGSQAATSIQNVEQETAQGKENINLCMLALDDMFSNQEGDLKKQFKTYSKTLSNLESQAKTVNKRITTMSARKNDYLKQWDAQIATIENPEIRQTAEQRREHVEEMFSRIQQEMTEAGTVFTPFLKKLNDIKTAVNMDLNRSGLTALQPVAEQAKRDADTITNHLDVVLSTLNETVSALTPTP